MKFNGRRIRPGFEDDEDRDVDLGGCETSLSLFEQRLDKLQIWKKYEYLVQWHILPNHVNVLSFTRAIWIFSYGLYP